MHFPLEQKRFLMSLMKFMRLMRIGLRQRPICIGGDSSRAAPEIAFAV